MYFRKMKKYTQEELAFRASISASYLSRIERGVYKKRFANIYTYEDCESFGS
ncbi:helix-turn-helix domain-containing protein [Megamonas funiformis]|uniref:helix-turn-helix domain-containing protein n=1 Tax=Megamonas funiformis TaxID=437897 RepID=UPI00356B2CE3